VLRHIVTLPASWVWFAHGKSSRSAERLSGTGAPALAGGAHAEEGSPSVRGGTAGRSPSAVGEPLGPALEASGFSGLRKAGRAGRKPRLRAEDLQKIERGLKRGPEALGYETGLWTAWRVAHLIEEECGVGYHASQVWRILRQLGWSCQRPAGRAVERDEEKIRIWKQKR
jgi:transposase